MASNKHEFKTAIFENGSCVVLRVDPSQPHFMEVVASFYDAERARDYARFENGQQGEHQEDAPIKEPASKPKAPASKAKPQPSEPISKAKPEASEAISKAKPQASEPIKDSTDLSERQQEVLNALRSLMDSVFDGQEKSRRGPISRIGQGVIHPARVASLRSRFAREKEHDQDRTPRVREVPGHL